MSPQDRHATVLGQLGAAIVRGELTPGQTLPADEIEARFQASRSVVREAVRVLESMGMVSSRRRVGVTVRERGAWNVFDPLLIRWRLDSPDRNDQLKSLSALRRGFEPLAAELAATHATADQSATLTGAVMDMVRYGQSGDLEAYLEADIVFHSTLLEASGNEMVAALRSVVAEVLAGRTHHHLMPATPNPEAIRLHSEIVTAVLSRDPATARRAMEDIIGEATAALAAQLDAS